jgi:hypothetical protein
MMQKFWLFLYKYAAKKLVGGKSRRYTAHELNSVLGGARNREVLVMPDGSIIAVSD